MFRPWRTIAERLAIVSFLIIALTGCRIIIEVGTGGRVLTDDWEYQCDSGETCIIDVPEGQGYSAGFFPAPAEGYIFAGWQKRGDFPSLCLGSTDFCALFDLPTYFTDRDIDTYLTPLFIERYADLEATGNRVRPGPNYVSLCTYEADVNNDVFGCELKYFPDYQTGLNLYDYVPTDARTLLTDYSTRKAELDRASASTKAELCFGGSDDMSVDLPAPTSGSGLVFDTDEFDSLAPFLDYFNQAAVDYVYYDGETRTQAFDFIVRHASALAEARSFLDHNPTDGRQFIPAQGVLTGLMIAWNAIEGDVAPGLFKDSVNDYIAEFMGILRLRYAEVFPGPPFERISRLSIGNRAFQRDMLALMYGIHSGKTEYFQRGVARYFQSLDAQIRADGSLIYSSQRGADAIGYSVEVMGFMIMIAEMLWHQGYDVYSTEIDGKSLETLIEFHVEAYADPTIMRQYTQYRNPHFCNPENANCAEDQWATQRLQDLDNSLGYSMLTTMEIYLRRFPATPLAARIREVMPTEQFTPTVSSTHGGRHTCHYREI